MSDSRYFAIVLMISGVLCCGCSTGGGKLVVDEIFGPVYVTEFVPADFCITTNFESGVGYQWAVDPADAAVIDYPASESIKLTANAVDADMIIKLRVTVTWSNVPPVVISRDITVKKIAAEISGPSSLSEYDAGIFAVDASPELELSYLWSCDPSDAGEFGSPSGWYSTEFRAFGVEAATDVTIGVKIALNGVERLDKTLNVAIVDEVDPESYLGGGHPIDGINYRRNNRSEYDLPMSLDGDDFVEMPFENSESITEISDGDFAVDSNERLYFGSLFTEYGDWWGPPKRSDTYLRRFSFGEDFGDPVLGSGILTAVSSQGVISFGQTVLVDPMEGHGDYYGRTDNNLYFRWFDPWPEISAEIGNYYGYVQMDIGSYPTGDAYPTVFLDFLPLPGGKIIAGVEILSSGDFFATKGYALEILDNELACIEVRDTPARLSAISFDDRRGVFYSEIGDQGLACYSWDFHELWNTYGAIRTSGGCPVIGDDGGIYDVLDGALQRIEPEGSQGWVLACGGHSRPVIMNDGAVAVITDSSVIFIDPVSFFTIGEIPLPTGEGTGGGFVFAPIVDRNDNLLLATGRDIYIISRDGTTLAQRTFDMEITQIRLGPEHLYVCMDTEIYRF